MVSGGSFTGRGGADASGIYNTGSSTTLEADGATVLGENGSGDNYGLNNRFSATATVTQSTLEGAIISVYYASGTVEVSNSRLVDGAVNSASVTCVLVTRGTTISTDSSTCP